MTTATAAIASHLNIAETIIASVEEWAHVLFVRFIGRRPRFVSKKVVEMDRQLVSAKEAAQKMAAIVGGKVWDKKPGEVRVYVANTNNGYLRFAPETADRSQIQYFMKSYDIPKVKAAVEAFNATYEISASVAPSAAEPQKFWRDEDGNIVDPDRDPAEAVYFG
jgi:hypothetical protein